MGNVRSLCRIRWPWDRLMIQLTVSRDYIIPVSTKTVIMHVIKESSIKIKCYFIQSVWDKLSYMSRKCKRKCCHWIMPLYRRKNILHHGVKRVLNLWWKLLGDQGTQTQPAPDQTAAVGFWQLCTKTLLIYQLKTQEHMTCRHTDTKPRPCVWCLDGTHWYLSIAQIYLFTSSVFPLFASLYLIPSLLLHASHSLPPSFPVRGSLLFWAAVLRLSPLRPGPAHWVPSSQRCRGDPWRPPLPGSRGFVPECSWWRRWPIG